MKYFDAHAHIQFDEYDIDREALTEEFKREEIGGLIVGVDAESSRGAIELCKTLPDFYPTVGIHPNYVPDIQAGEWEEVTTLAEADAVKAIGECGLDYFRPADVNVAKDPQKEMFARHVELAVTLGKPLMIHGRPSKGTMDAYEDMLDILEEAHKKYGERLRGDIHFFVGNVAVAERFLHIGFTMSFTAVITFTHDYDEVVNFLPLESILSETDSPYVAPAPNRGKRNDPRAVKAVVSRIAEIKRIDEPTVAKAIIANTKRVFAL